MQDKVRCIKKVIQPSHKRKFLNENNSQHQIITGKMEKPKFLKNLVI